MTKPKAEWRLTVMSYRCPYCGAAPGAACTSRTGRKVQDLPHAGRSRLAANHHWRFAEVEEPEA